VVRRVCAALLALLLTLCLPAAARAEDDAHKGTRHTVVDEDELAALVGQAAADTHCAGAEISVAVCFTRTGETWSWNGDEWYYTASLYKLPMIMRFTRMAEEGGLDGLPAYYTEQTETIKERVLVYSDNSWASALWRQVFTEPDAVPQLSLDYAHFPADELPADYFQTMHYSAPFMLGIVRELYDHPDEYPGVLDYMRLAQPEQYFRRELEGRYEIAQKYGSADGVNHAAGVIWTPSPILLVVMSDGLGPLLGDILIGRVAAAMADYALVVDERADEWERLEAEAAEQDALAAEQAAAARAAETPAPEPQPEEAPAAEAAALRATPPRWPLLLAVPLAAAGVWAYRRGKKDRRKERDEKS